MFPWILRVVVVVVVEWLDFLKEYSVLKRLTLAKLFVDFRR